MDGKEIRAIITIIVAIPTFIALMIWMHNVSKNPSDPNQLSEGAKIAAESAIPWWLGILQWLAGLPGIIGAILIIAFFWFLKWIGELK